MGKAALIMVLGTGILVSYGVLSSTETAQFTAKSQGSYEENVLAREIARTGFNAAMGILHDRGDDIHQAVRDINGEAGYLQVASQGGYYRASARHRSGHEVEVSATGYFGGSWDGDTYTGATHTMDDNFVYAVPTSPLITKECGQLEVTFIDSQAGYCSAVFLERRLAGESTSEDPELVIPAGNNRDGSKNAFRDTLAAGTQMNFFIGVDMNCSERPETKHGKPWYEYDVDTYDTDDISSDFDHLHYALDLDTHNLSYIREGVYGFVEQHPDENQTWRIAWEDQHRTEWDNAATTDVTRSLQALKAFGYDGNGWPDTDKWGFRALRDYSSRPDFSDQVIQVKVLDTGGTCPSTAPPTSTSTGTPSTPPPPYTLGETSADCECQKNNKKVRVMHRPPGNPENEHPICISENGWENGHSDRHDDYLICRGI